jgi:hypothetical protein
MKWIHKVAVPLTLLALLASTPATEAPTLSVWATVEKSPAFNWNGLVLEFGTVPQVPGTTRSSRTYVRQTTTRAASVFVRWADTATCPVLARISDDLRVVPDLPPALGGRKERYTLSFAGRHRASGDVNSNLSRWTEQALTELAPCWRDLPNTGTEVSMRR